MHGPRNDTRGIAANAPNSELAGLLDASAADVLLVGHPHAPFARALRDGRLVCSEVLVAETGVVDRELGKRRQAALVAHGERLEVDGLVDRASLAGPVVTASSTAPRGSGTRAPASRWPSPSCIATRSQRRRAAATARA
jgi:hypothetical protein